MTAHFPDSYARDASVQDQIAAHLSQLWQQPVRIKGSDFGDETIVTIGDNTHYIPLSSEIMAVGDPLHIATDLLVFLPADQITTSLNTTFNLPLQEYRRWISRGSAGNVKPDPRANPQDDEARQAKMRHINVAHQALENRLNTLAMTSSQETVVLPKSLSTLLQVHRQFHWQQQNQMHSGRHEYPQSFSNSSAVVWSEMTNRIGWQTGTLFSNLYLSAAQKAPIQDALNTLNALRQDAGLDTITEDDIELCTCHDLTLSAFDALRPHLAMMDQPAIHRLAQRLFDLHSEKSDSLSLSQLTNELIKIGDTYDLRCDPATAHRIASTLHVIPPPEREGDSLHYATIETLHTYYDLARQITAPAINPQITRALYRDFAPTASNTLVPNDARAQSTPKKAFR